MVFTGNRMQYNTANGWTMQQDAAGNQTFDGGQHYSYDATGQQAFASLYTTEQGYDGDRLRVRRSENWAATYYVRSSVLGGQVVAEVTSGGGWQRGYVYLGSQLLALQAGGVEWAHQDPVTKSQRLTNVNGAVTVIVEADPWGGESWGWSSNSWWQPRRYTSYTRDGNGSDEAMMRRYNRLWAKFEQPDPYDGSYDLSDPQSLNRYAYAGNDPVNFTDPTGLDDRFKLGVGGPVVVVGEIDSAVRGGTLSSLAGLLAGGSGSPLDMYLPEDPSVGNEGEGGGAPPPTGTNTRKLEAALDSCIKKLFGVSLTSFKPSQRGKNRSVTVNFTDPNRRLNGLTGFGVVNDVTTYSRSTARTYVNSNYAANGQPPLPSNSVIYGFTSSSSPHINFTVNDEKNSVNILKTQIHELGHSLEHILGISKYKEAGWELENCVAKEGGFRRS
jgi:RHS repeat-associated protein